MSLDQRRARWFGVLYLMTFVTSIAALAALRDRCSDIRWSYIAGAGHDNQGLGRGSARSCLLIIADVGTAIMIFPILRQQSKELALGYVAAQLVECTLDPPVGIVYHAGDDHAASTGCRAHLEGTVAYTFAALKDWTFLLGPGWVVGWGNGLILGYLMYRSRPGAATRRPGSG